MSWVVAFCSAVVAAEATLNVSETMTAVVVAHKLTASIDAEAGLDSAVDAKIYATHDRSQNNFIFFDQRSAQRSAVITLI